jgi:hypothetical protein
MLRRRPARGEHADVVVDDEVAAADPGDGAGDRPVGLGLPDRCGEGLQGEPGDTQVLLDRGVGQGFGQMGFPGPVGPGSSALRRELVQLASPSATDWSDCTERCSWPPI